MEVCSILRADQRANFHLRLWGKTRNINRIESDPIEKLAFRISCILEKDLKRLNSSKKKKAEDGNPEPVPSFVPDTILKNSNGERIDPATTIADALQLSDLTLHVGDDAFMCLINPPRIKALTLSPQGLTGLYIYAACDAADSESVLYKWYIGADSKGLEDEIDTRCLEHLRLAVERCCVKKNVQKPQHFRIHSTSTVPKLRLTAAETDKIICCLAVPTGADKELPGIPLGATTKLPVIPGPDECPYHRRQEETKSRFYEVENSDKIRVVSYNILSDGLAETAFSKDGLFPYCPEEFVSWNYREHLLLDEIIGYNPDLICLQELDSKCFKGNFYQVLKQEGFQGFFSNKSSSPEGVCSLWNTKSFEMISTREYPTVGPLLDKEDKLFADLHEIIEKCKPMNEKEKEKKPTGRLILELPHLVQIIHLRHRGTKNRVLLVNTHLYWHPRGANIRMIQSEVIARLIKREKDILESQFGEEFSVVFGGDFNSTANTAAVRYFLGETIQPNDIDFFTSGKDGVFQLDEPLVPKIVFESGIQPIPEYSNYVGPFRGQLDYILFHNLSYVSCCVPFAHADVVRNSGIPSKYFASDHLAQVSVLKFNQK